MAQTLSTYLRSYLASPAQFRQSLAYPVLVWSIGQKEPKALGDDHGLQPTATGSAPRRPRLGVPIAFEVRKDAHKKNPLPNAVTVGRMPNNDIVVDDPALSRFHAYFSPPAKGARWTLTDAESKHGTFVKGERLEPGEHRDLVNDVEVRFGVVSMRFFLPEGLVAYLGAVKELGL
jgi:hypothetical protein